MLQQNTWENQFLGGKVSLTSGVSVQLSQWRSRRGKSMSQQVTLQPQRGSRKKGTQAQLTSSLSLALGLQFRGQH